MKLTLVATPIGNLGDLSPRASAALAEAELWFVEDTRVSGKLQSHLSCRAPMRVLNDHTGDDRIRGYLEALKGVERAVVVTDAGTPGISDPGARLVDLCYEAGFEVDAIPGPSAVSNALALSGFYAQRYAFLGYLPRKPGAQRQVLAEFAESSLALVLFESPFRTEKLMEILAEVLGRRRYAICREMTKLHQQVYRQRLPERPSESEVPAKGEYTIVVEGLRRNEEIDGE